ncbi:MAG TPA: hypothetical protein VFW47_10340, partial [Phenylobacterium sp.]|nr:hypothetical protein [Phenylobacterium sp.]
MLIAVRFTHYVALSVLFGAALFPLYARQPPDPAQAPVVGLPGRWLVVIAWGALLTTLGWFSATVGEMSGDPAAGLSPAVLWSVVRDMEFGRLAVAQVALSLLAIGLAKGFRRPAALALVSGLLLASLAGTGHARLDTGTLGAWPIFAGALHLLAAGAWIGGLVALAAVMGRLRRAAGLMERAALGRILRRFS